MSRADFIIVGLGCAGLISALPGADLKPLKTVDSVDLKRYVGDWYEIARYPNRIQKQCAGDIHARYTLLDDSKLSVRNECRKANGQPDVSSGTAKIADPKTNAKLKVTLFWPFSRDYWIIDLDPNYRYAAVGEPDRKYLWILSRAKDLDEASYQKILKHLAENGYDTSKLVKTKQSHETASPASGSGFSTLAQIADFR